MHCRRVWGLLPPPSQLLQTHLLGEEVLVIFLLFAFSRQGQLPVFTRAGAGPPGLLRVGLLGGGLQATRPPPRPCCVAACLQWALIRHTRPPAAQKVRRPAGEGPMRLPHDAPMSARAQGQHKPTWTRSAPDWADELPWCSVLSAPATEGQPVLLTLSIPCSSKFTPIVYWIAKQQVLALHPPGGHQDGGQRGPQELCSRAQGL